MALWSKALKLQCYSTVLDTLHRVARCTTATVLTEGVSMVRECLGIELAAFCLGITLTMMAISTKYSLAHEEIETLITQDNE